MISSKAKGKVGLKSINTKQTTASNKPTYSNPTKATIPQYRIRNKLTTHPSHMSPTITINLLNTNPNPPTPSTTSSLSVKVPKQKLTIFSHPIITKKRKIILNNKITPSLTPHCPPSSPSTNEPPKSSLP